MSHVWNKKVVQQILGKLKKQMVTSETIILRDNRRECVGVHHLQLQSGVV